MKQNIFNGLVPMMAVFMLLTIWPTNANAKKIKYGENCRYDGKVDKNGNPSGEGKITFYGNRYYYDVLRGFFDGNRVSNATIEFSDSNQDFFDSFSGSLEYTLTDNGEEIVYKLTSGTLKSKFNDRGYECRADDPCILKRCKFGTETCEASGTLYLPVNKAYDIHPIGIEQIGHLKSNYEIYGWWHGQKYEFRLRLKKSCLLFDNDIKVVDGKSIEYPNGDFFRHDGTSLLDFRKQYNDGMAKLCSEGTIEYSKSGKTGVAFFENSKDLSSLFNLVMKADEFPEAKFSKRYTGEIAEYFIGAIKNDANAQYKLGMAYLDGNVIDKNKELAKKWLEKANMNGNVEAEDALDKIKEQEAAELRARKEQEAAELRARNEAILQPHKQRAIQNKDKVLAYDIAYGYENGGEQQISIFEEGQIFGTIKKCTFVQNDDSAMVWYKKCVAYGNDPTKSDKPNLYKAYKRIEQLRRIIEKTEKFLPKYTKKYGQSAGTSLYKGRFNGLSFAAVNEFLRDLNSAENKYVLQAYEPTVSDVLKYGRGVKNYTLFSTGTFAINLTEIKVLNGKVIAQRNDYYGGMEQVISSYKESLDIYRDEGWIRRLDRINNK